MKMVDEASRNVALSNALSSVRRDKHFPNKVFVGDWKDYLFFEPHMIFDVGFIGVANLLLRDERASVIALINLGNDMTTSDKDPRAIFLERDTAPTEYISELKGDGSPMNWMFLMDRYVCASDKGNWSIYCEKENDIAAFACRQGFSRSTCSQIENLLKARSIRFASRSGESQLLFNFDKLASDWKSTLIAEYAPSGAL